MDDGSVVQKLAKQFEQLTDITTNAVPDNNIRIHKCNWWLQDRDSISEFKQNIESDDSDVARNNHEIEQDIDVGISTPSSQRASENVIFQIVKIIDELHETEQSYIETLSKGFDDYISIFDDPDLPNSLRGQKNKLFSTLERIRNLHQDQIWPLIQQCENDVERLCQTIHKFIEDDLFYIYIQYAINKKLSDEICEKNREYFQLHQDRVNDRLGILSILVQPIQRLPRYKLLLLNLLENLLKQMETEDIKEQIAWCCKAEKNMSRFLDTFNESMSINDIIECNNINTTHQGKFYKATDFDILDPVKRLFRGRVFLFEKCIICTEIIDKNAYLYRSHFLHTDSHLEYKGKSKFKLSTNIKRHKKFSFLNDFPVIQSWITLLESLRVQAHENNKRRSFEPYRNSSDIFRNSSRTSSESTSTSSTARSSNSSRNSSDKVFDSSAEDNLQRATIWYAHK